MLGASQTTGERLQPIVQRSLIPQSSGIFEGAVLCHCAAAGDDRVVDLPNAANVLSNGRAYAGLSASAGPTVLPQDLSITVQMGGVGKAVLLANTTCNAGGDVGYDPGDGGYVKQVTTANQGQVVVIGRFTQNKGSSSSPQMVGVHLYAQGAVGTKLLGDILTTSATIFNLTAETAFALVISLPANRLAAGSLLDISAKALITSGNGNDTLKLSCRLDSATGVLLGSTPAVDVTNGGGDLGVLDLHATVRTIGSSGTLAVGGLGGISPGQAVATGGNVQATGTAGAVAIDTTVAHTLVITATWSAASASDVVQLENFVVTIT